MATLKPRLSVTLSEVNYKKLNNYAEMMGMTMSGLAAFGLAQYLLTLDKTIPALDSLPEVASGQITLEEVLRRIHTDDEE